VCIFISSSLNIIHHLPTFSDCLLDVDKVSWHKYLFPIRSEFINLWIMILAFIYQTISICRCHTLSLLWYLINNVFVLKVHTNCKCCVDINTLHCLWGCDKRPQQSGNSWAVNRNCPILSQTICKDEIKSKYISFIRGKFHDENMNVTGTHIARVYWSL